MGNHGDTLLNAPCLGAPGKAPTDGGQWGLGATDASDPGWKDKRRSLRM